MYLISSVYLKAMLSVSSSPQLTAYCNSFSMGSFPGRITLQGSQRLSLKCKSGHVIPWLKVFSASLLSTRQSLEASACHSRHGPIWPQPHFPTSSAISHKAPALYSDHIIHFIFMLFRMFFLFYLLCLMTIQLLFLDSPQVYFL